MAEVGGPLSPASVTSPSGRGVLSPQSTRSGVVGVEEESMADFSCSMFSPKNWGSGGGSGDVNDEMDILSDNEPMSPKSPCSCDGESVPVNPMSPHTPNPLVTTGDGGVGANNLRESPGHSVRSILPDSEDESSFEEKDKEESNDDSEGCTGKKKGKKKKSKDEKKKKDKKKKEMKAVVEKKPKKHVAFVEKNPTPLSPPMSPMSNYTDCSSRMYDQGGQSESMLSPRNDDEETLSLEDNVAPDWMSNSDVSHDSDSDEDDGSKKQSLFSKAKNRKLLGIHAPTPKTSHTANVDVIPDDDSEASIMVLMRYMGCTPVAYGEGARPPRTPTGREFVFDSFDDDDNSLLSDEEYEEDSHVSQQQEILTSWTMKNEEVGVEMGLDDLVLQSPISPRAEPEKQPKKKKGKLGLTVDTAEKKKKKKKAKKKKTEGDDEENVAVECYVASPGSAMSPGMESLRSMASPRSTSVASFKPSTVASPYSVLTSPGIAAASPGSAVASSVASRKYYTGPDDLVSRIKSLQLPKSPAAGAVDAGDANVLSDDDLKDFLEGKAVSTKKKASAVTAAPSVTAASTKKEISGDNVETLAQEKIALLKARAARALEISAETRAGTPRSIKATTPRSMDTKTGSLQNSSDPTSKSTTKKGETDAKPSKKTSSKVPSAKKSTSSDPSKKKKKKKTKKVAAAAAASAKQPQDQACGAEGQQQQSPSPTSAKSKSGGSSTNSLTASAPNSVGSPLSKNSLSGPCSPTNAVDYAPSDERTLKEVVKLEESPSARSDKENGRDGDIEASQSELSTASKKKPLSINTGASVVAPAGVGQLLTPGTTKSVQEVDELLSKTREWLVRHNESQLSKKKPSQASTATPSTVAKPLLTTKSSTPSAERKVMGNITSMTVLKNATTQPSPSTPRSLAEQMLKSKGITIAPGARESPLSLLSPASSSNSTGPKKTIMEQLNEIRAKQRELELRQKKKSATASA